MELDHKERTSAEPVLRVEMPSYEGFPNTEPLKVDERVQEFSRWLGSCGVSPENMLTEYLNEYIRIAVEYHGLNWSSLLMGQLMEQTAEMFSLLHKANLIAFNARDAAKDAQK